MGSVVKLGAGSVVSEAEVAGAETTEESFAAKQKNINFNN